MIFASTLLLLYLYFPSTYPLHSFYYRSTCSQRAILIAFLGLKGNVPGLGIKRSLAGNKTFPPWERIADWRVLRQKAGMFGQVEAR